MSEKTLFVVQHFNRDTKGEIMETDRHLIRASSAAKAAHFVMQTRKATANDVAGLMKTGMSIEEAE